MGALSRFLERRNWRRRTRAYLQVLQREPADSDVRWLADLDPRADLDHACWELRYARLALGQLAAERDALDDRVPALVARDVAESLARDPRVGADMVAVAERQLQTRLKHYREVMGQRAAEPLATRLGRELLTFAHGAAKDSAVERAGEILRRYLTEANAALQAAYGRATLPEDVRPSELTAG